MEDVKKNNIKTKQQEKHREKNTIGGGTNNIVRFSGENVAGPGSRSHFGSRGCVHFSLFFWPWPSMPRTGWTAVETPNGWFQLIRGPRPPSVCWEKATRPESRVHGTGRWRQPKDNVKSVESRSVKPIPHRSRVDPEVAIENAQSKVARLQKALEAVGDMGGVVVESLQAELAKVQAAAVSPPVDVQISKCKEFIERSQRRLVWLEAGESVWPDWRRTRGPTIHQPHPHRLVFEWIS